MYVGQTSTEQKCNVASSTLTNLLHHHSHLVELLDDTFPVDRSRLDDIIQLEDNEAVRQVVVDTVHVRRHAHTVHPVAVHCPITFMLHIQQISNAQLVYNNYKKL